MYGSVAGLGLFTAPMALALTGVGRPWIVATGVLALLLIVLGIALLRASHRELFR